MSEFDDLLEKETQQHAQRMQRHADEMYAGMIAIATGNADIWWQRKFDQAMKLVDEQGSGNPGSDPASDSAP